MVEETAAIPFVDPVHVILDLSEFVQVHEEEVEETEPLIASRRRSVDLVAVDEPELKIIEASPSAIVADVLDNLESDEVVEPQPGAEGDNRDTQSFGFDTREDEELQTEALVEQPVEVTQAKAET